MHATDIKARERLARRGRRGAGVGARRGEGAAEAAAESERRFADELGASETARRDAEAKTVGLQKQNALLLGQLEDAQKAADGVADEDGENAGRRKLHEVVTFLRNEKEAALGQVEVLSLEVSRWKRSAETSKAESAQSAKRAKELEKRVGKTESEGESKIEALKAKIEHLNVVSESNAALRAELDASKKAVAEEKKKAKAASAAEERARKAAAAAKAEADGAAGEREILKQDAARWEARTTQLLEKYGQVDVAEYERVKAELAAAKKGTDEGLKEAKKTAAEAAKAAKGAGDGRARARSASQLETATAP